MRYRINLSPQAVEFTASLSPSNRLACKRALISLQERKGNILALQGRLAGFYRLRVGRVRYILAIRSGMVIDVIYAEERNVVYQTFESRIKGGD